MEIKTVVEYQIPDFLLPALINGDISGLEVEDLELVVKAEKEFTSLLEENNGSSYALEIPKDDQEAYSCTDPDFTSKACNVYDLNLVIFEKEKLYNSSNYGNDLELTMEQAEQGYHSGDCESDVKALMEVPEVKKQLEKLDKETLKKELKDYGAWDEEQLNNHEENLMRWLWMSCGDIVDKN